MTILLLQRDFLRFFIDNTQNVRNWESTATSWVITAIVVAVLGAGAIFGVKALRKRTTGIERHKLWTRGQTWLLILVGIFPIFLALWVVWWLTRDYRNFVEVGGLLKGVVLAWLTYLLIMVAGHLASPWRRELF